LWQGGPVVQRVVVVGASLAGLRACESLRFEGFDGEIVLVGAEEHLPYDRPPLSKKVLAGEWEPDRIALRTPESIAELEVDLRLGIRATGLDTAAPHVELEGATRLAYDGLIIATGSEVRRLPEQPDLPGVHVLRRLDESLALRAELAGGGARVVVVGAGFIGAEVAATARQLGCEVTIVEALDAPLVRGIGREMGLACAQLHHDNGVTLRLDTGVEEIAGGTRVDRVRLTDGTVLPADVVVVGIGVVPATGWLAGSGLDLRDGAVCAATLAAGPPGVFAAGDCARWPHQLFGEELRIEHWTNAAEQGARAAKNLLAAAAGQPGEPYAEVPFFWSDQYGSRIQFLGRGDGDVRVVVGDVDERKFVAVYSRDGIVRGALGLDSPRALMGFRRLIAARASMDDVVAHAATLA
jgi:NADPH-dependent 2,4-dienoyl-CoA reductase/sulfur reductase-like enzyme